MSKFTINDIEEGNGNFVPTINPGIHEVEILGVEVLNKETDEKATDVTVKMVNLRGNMQYVFHNYTSEKAMPYNLQKAKHIAVATLTPEGMDKLGGETQEELLLSILTALEGKKARIKFSGEEYINNEGEVKIRTVIGLPLFAENIEVPQNESALRYNPNSKWDFKQLPDEIKQAANPDTGNTDEKLKDLKF